MQIQTLDELLCGVKNYSDIELKIFRDHALDMLYKLQYSGDLEALDYWSTLVEMINCELNNRAV
jgi:hypothetical protein